MANVINRSVGRSHEVYASAARTVTPDTQELELPGGAVYGTFFLDVTAITDTPTVTLKIEGVDRASGKAWEIIEAAGVSTAVTQQTFVGPEFTAGAGTAKAALPPVIRVTVTHTDADSITYSLGAHFS